MHDDIQSVRIILFYLAYASTIKICVRRMMMKMTGEKQEEEEEELEKANERNLAWPDGCKNQT